MFYEFVLATLEVTSLSVSILRKMSWRYTERASYYVFKQTIQVLCNNEFCKQIIGKEKEIELIERRTFNIKTFNFNKLQQLMLTLLEKNRQVLL